MKPSSAGSTNRPQKPGRLTKSNLIRSLVLLAVVSFAELESSSGWISSGSLFFAQAVSLNSHSGSESLQKSGDGDDDDVNVDPNMASGENQYMFGAAVNQVESNQADKEDKGEDGSADKADQKKKEAAEPVKDQNLEQSGDELDTSDFDAM